MTFKELVALAEKFYKEIPGKRVRGLAVFAELAKQSEEKLLDAVIGSAQDANKVGTGVTKNFMDVLVVIAKVKLGEKKQTEETREEVIGLAKAGKNVLIGLTRPSLLATTLQTVTSFFYSPSASTTQSACITSYDQFIEAACGFIKIKAVVSKQPIKLGTVTKDLSYAGAVKKINSSHPESPLEQKFQSDYADRQNNSSTENPDSNATSKFKRV